MAEQTELPVKTNGHELRRWDPFELLDDLQQQMLRRWNLAWPRVGRAVPAMSTPAGWLPTMDVFEKEGKLIAQVELPGMKKEDIEVTLDDADLIIRGERKAETEVKEEAYYRLERTYGTFYRRLPLPFAAKPEEITATYEHGVLRVEVPKPAVAPPKTQKIDVT